MNEEGRGGYRERDATLLDLGFSSYPEYRKSDLWESIRMRVRHRDRNRCRLCPKRGRQVHHLDYRRSTLAGESIAGLVLLCTPCHVAVEFNGKRKRTMAEALKTYRTILGATKPARKRKAKKSAAKQEDQDPAQRARDLVRLADIKRRQKAWTPKKKRRAA